MTSSHRGVCVACDGRSRFWTGNLLSKRRYANAAWLRYPRSGSDDVVEIEYPIHSRHVVHIFPRHGGSHLSVLLEKSLTCGKRRSPVFLPLHFPFIWPHLAISVTSAGRNVPRNSTLWEQLQQFNAGAAQFIILPFYCHSIQLNNDFGVYIWNICFQFQFLRRFLLKWTQPAWFHRFLFREFLHASPLHAISLPGWRKSQLPSALRVVLNGSKALRLRLLMLNKWECLSNAFEMLRLFQRGVIPLLIFVLMEMITRRTVFYE